MTPADELRTAAAKLRDAETQDMTSITEVMLRKSWSQGRTCITQVQHPSVGTALADWLDDAADGDDYGEINPYALAVARAILGDPS